MTSTTCGTVWEQHPAPPATWCVPGWCRGGHDADLGGIEPVARHERDELLALLVSEPEPDELVAFLTRRFAPPVLANADGDPIDLDHLLREAGEAGSSNADVALDLDDPAVREAMTAYPADSERRWLDLSVPALRG